MDHCVRIAAIPPRCERVEEIHIVHTLARAAVHTDDPQLLDLRALDAAPLVEDPFPHLVVPDFVPPAMHAAIAQDFPAIVGPGAHPVETLGLQGTMAALWSQLSAPEFKAAIGRKFGMDLGACSTMGTLRGHCERADGAIHTDSKTKLVTVLVYFNADWPHAGGRLRMLRSATNLDDYATEVAPLAGTMLAFRRSERSWHGHLPHAGPRRMLQLHFVDAKRQARNGRKRGTLAWRLKKWLSLG